MAESDLPMVTVIAPCRNEAGFAEQALTSILDSDYPAHLIELLVVDGMSTDGTREIVRKMCERDARIRLIDNRRKIVPTAMNIGIESAKGKYILRIDCHSVFAPEYISKCVDALNRTSADGVGGYIKTLAGKDTPVGRAIAAATSSRFGVGNSQFRLTGPEQEVDTVPFGAYRKDVFKKVGLYDERLVRNQDIELNSRIRKAGGKVIISPEIQLSYYNRATYRGLWQQSFNNGLWNPYTIWLAGGGLSLRHFVPMLFILGLITVGAGALYCTLFRWLLLLYVGIYLLAASCFSLQRSRKTNARAGLILWSFVVLHVAYGLGSFWGMITIPFKFRNRSTDSVVKPLADRRI
jgi:glycosyltransferase involved in cell wall biosynthesis